MDYGIPAGLAVKVPFSQYAQEDRQQAQDLENAKSRAESRAKLLSEDFDYSNALNAFDHAIIKDYSTKAITGIGKWERENPGWQYNPQLYTQRKSMLKDLKDNDHLHKGMRVDEEIKKMQAFRSDPKNADLLEDPDYKQHNDALKNYLNTGSIDGVTEHGIEFKFNPPSAYDFNPLLEQYGKKAQKTLKGRSVLANGLLSLQYGSTDDSIKQLADTYLANLDPTQSRRWAYNYKQKLSQLGLSPEKYSLQKYTKDVLDGHVSPDEYQHAGYHVNDKGGGSSGGKFSVGNSLLSTVLNKSYAKAGTPVQYTPASAEELYIGKNNKLNTQGAKMFTKDVNGNLKNVISLNPVSTDGWDFSNTKIVSYPVYNPATKKHDAHSSFVSGTVLLTPEEFNQMTGDEEAVSDPWFGGTELQKKYRNDAKIVTKKGKDGKEVELVEATIHMPLEAQNPQVHYASDHGAGTKPLEYGYGGDDRYLVSPDGTMFQDTHTGIIYDAKTKKPVAQ